LLLPLLALPSGARAAADLATVEELAGRARALRLSEETEWLRLGHWRRTLLGGWKSEADGADFFLARGGKTDPAAELEATLRGMFGFIPLTPDEAARNVVPAACRFPARAAWLFGKLGFDPALLPQQDCPRLDEYWQRVQPEAASLVFSSYYLNNPASAFGHTFLRIRKRGEGVSPERRELLDSGIDYSATADTGNPVLYAFKGLTGLFPGSFHLFPYYYKVREYNDYESRDIWEYDLDLTPAQLAMLAAHIFELGSTYFDYYYIDENCSYHVLAALEAAAPELRLLEHVKTPVVPADTVKALFANPGLVKGVRYRPSAMTQFRARIAGMPGDQLDAVQALASDPQAPVQFPPAEQIRVFDAAADLIDVRYAKDLPITPEGKGGQIKQAVLERRARILQPSPELPVRPPLDKRPDAGHGSMRSLVSAGWSSARGPMLSLGYRLGLHDLDDPPAGYPELAQIEFFPVELRAYPRGGAVELESIDLVNVVSLHAVSSFDQSLSWKVRLGAHRLRDGACDGCLAGTFELGSGFTVALAQERFALFALGDLAVDASPSLRGLEKAPALRAGIGPSGGARLRLGDRAVWIASARWLYFPAALVRTGWSLQSSVRWEARPNFCIGLDWKREIGATEAALQILIYF
jgi:hypothetical protein